VQLLYGIASKSVKLAQLSGRPCRARVIRKSDRGDKSPSAWNRTPLAWWRQPMLNRSSLIIVSMRFTRCLQDALTALSRLAAEIDREVVAVLPWSDRRVLRSAPEVSPRGWAARRLRGVLTV